MTEWVPATEAEAAMRDALRADDQELYFRILARSELLLPISSDAIAGRAPMGWGTWTVGQRTHVLAFTSSEAMHACLAEHAGSARKIPYYELAAAWPNLEWWLAVNPGLPIEGYLPAWFVSQLARGDVRLPGRTSGRQAVIARAETLERRAALEPRSTPEPRSRLEPRPRDISSWRGGAGRARVPVPPVPAQAEPVEPIQPVERMEPPAVRGETAAPAGPRQPIGLPFGTTATAEPTPPREPVELAPLEPGPAELGPAADSPPGRAGGASGAEPAGAAPDPLAGFAPANDTEEQLAQAVAVGGLGNFLSVLLLAKVLLPVADGAEPSVKPGQTGFTWRTEKIDDSHCVVVFTSPERLDAHLDSPVEVLGVRFVQLIRAWPDDSWSLVVNPGTPIAATLPGTQVTKLASSAAEVGLDDDAGEARESTSGASGVRASQAETPVAMEKVIAPSQVGWYLERGYDRVSGFVHRAPEVAHLSTPAAMVAALGLRYEDSPFGAQLDEVYVLRWQAFCPYLYRIPYGGRTEAAMNAMQGWVIERAPFRGNGFAPAENGDVIAEFKVDSVRLPHGAQLLRTDADGTQTLVAVLDADGPTWQRVSPGGEPPAAAGGAAAPPAPESEPAGAEATDA